ncbi:MAG TPA: branched-chain amino acid ABC transporter permease [Intrasporangiaceae bacterium]|nr:branched-chain amino acid ABC transporter permease [Intrasporangiaceae bacterium]
MTNRATLIKSGLAALLVVFAALLPRLNISVPGVLPGPTYTPGTLQVLAYAFLIAALALSYHLVFGLAGLLSFGHALFFGAGAYGLAMILKQLLPAEMSSGTALLIAIGLTLVFAFILASAVGALALRVSGITFAMVTLACAQAMNVLVRRNTGGLTGGEEGVSITSSMVPSFLIGVRNSANLYWIALAILVVVYLATLWVERSRVGHVAAAARENELRVRVLGLRPYTVRLFVFTAAGMLAAIAGMGMVLLQSGTTPRVTSADFTLTILVIVVLGGVGFRWGAIVGGLVYTLLDKRLSDLASASFIDSLPSVLRIPLSEPVFILGMVFVLVVMFVPGGIAGITDRVRRGAPVTSSLEEAGELSADTGAGEQEESVHERS